MRLLIIEDDREAGNYLVKAFREQGHMAELAPDGLEGYALARESQYDVLIVDRMLPKLDGLSLIAGLREQKIDTPVLILSALGQVDDRVKDCAPAATIISPSPTPFPSFSRAPRRWRAAVPGRAARTRSIGSAISNSIA